MLDKFDVFILIYISIIFVAPWLVVVVNMIKLMKANKGKSKNINSNKYSRSIINNSPRVIEAKSKLMKSFILCVSCWGGGFLILMIVGICDYYLNT